ncbi:MAG: hypothetical protein HYS19_07130 [Nitrosomonadales bacterium]|nr:hypothetical protein [Nitrosomonadales bacterium]
MTEFPLIQTRVCEDVIRRMVQAKKQKDKAVFDLEKEKLLDVLAILKAADTNNYKKYSKYGEMEFQSDSF